MCAFHLFSSQSSVYTFQTFDDTTTSVIITIDKNETPTFFYICICEWLR